MTYFYWRGKSTNFHYFVLLIMCGIILIPHKEPSIFYNNNISTNYNLRKALEHISPDNIICGLESDVIYLLLSNLQFIFGCLLCSQEIEWVSFILVMKQHVGVAWQILRCNAQQTMPLVSFSLHKPPHISGLFHLNGFLLQTPITLIAQKQHIPTVCRAV